MGWVNGGNMRALHLVLLSVSISVTAVSPVDLHAVMNLCAVFKRVSSGEVPSPWTLNRDQGRFCRPPRAPPAPKLHLLSPLRSGIKTSRDYLI